MLEHTSAAQQQVESTHSPLAIALRDAINSASSMTQTLSSELADGQRKLVALAVAGANSKAGNPLITQLSNGPMDGFRKKIEAPVDPTKKLSRLVYEHKYEEAFTAALQRSDVWIVSWLCSQVDLQGILTSNPLPLSQGVLLSLLQQVACDIGNDTSRKLAWMMDLVVAIKPSDGMIAMHVRPIFDQVYSILNHQMSLPTTSVSELSSIRVVIKLINSTLRTLASSSHRSLSLSHRSLSEWWVFLGTLMAGHVTFFSGSSLLPPAALDPSLGLHNQLLLRVIQESKSLLENPHLAARFSKAKNVQNRGGASTPVVSKTQSCEQPQEVINLAKPKAKIQMLRDTRDYSFLLSEDADLPAPIKNPPKSMPAPANNPPKRMPAPTNNPSKSMPAPTRNPPKSMPAPKPEVHPSQRKTSNTARKVINGVEERKSSPKVSQMRAKAGLSIQKPSTAAKLTSTSLEPRKQLSRNDGSGPARPSVPKALPLKEPVARKENVFSASVAKGSVPSVHKSLHSKPPPSVHKKPVAQKRDYRESCKGNVIAKKPMLSSKPQIKQQPAKVPPSAQQKERLKKRPLRSYSDDDDGAISMIRSMFGYNPSRYRGVDEDDDSDMEAGFDDIMMEENHSARIAAKEDEEELRKIKEEEERERMRKAAKKRKLNQQ